MADYLAVGNENQGSFNNPRQKQWCVQKKGAYGWSIELITNSFDEAKNSAKRILAKGGMYTSIDRIMVSEITPIDTIITPIV